MAKIVNAITHDLGGLQVQRVLPHKEKTMVGPFIFFDQMGPSTFSAGQGINVRPHPHIGLSTLTYLFEGRILHRDSLGHHLEIKPGDVNWMTAGRGITHSERETFEVRASDHVIHGLQCWIALPEAMSEIEPSFTHVKKEALPHQIQEGVMMRLIVGDAYGMSSPIKTYSPLFYVDILASHGSVIQKPHPTHETALFIVTGQIAINGTVYEPGQFVLLAETDSEIEVITAGRFILLGGEPFERTPYVFWNFVAFDRKRIQQAKSDWENGLFPKIPGDDQERIPIKK